MAAKLLPSKPMMGQRVGRQKSVGFTVDDLIAGGYGRYDVGSVRCGDNDVADWTLGRLTIRAMRSMSLNPTLALARMVVGAPIKSGDWTLQVDGDAPEGVEEVVRDSIGKETLRFIVREACRAFEYGFQSLEEVWEAGGDGGGMRWRIAKFKSLLPELTTPMVIESTGEFAGVQQRGLNGQQVQLQPEECLHFTYDQEGDNYRGRSRHEAARIPFRAWNRMMRRVDDFARKVSGVLPIMRYPPGTSLDKTGAEIDNGTIAQRVIQALGNVEGVTFPATIAKWAEDLLRAGADPEKLFAWTLTFADTKGTQGGDLVTALRYQDSLLFRSWLAPERSATEGQAGTKAEAQTHGALVIEASDEFRQDIARMVNWHAVDRVVRYNFGERAVGCIKWVPQPLADEALDRMQTLVDQMVTGQFTMQSMMDVIDVDAMIDNSGLPRVTGEDGKPKKFMPPVVVQTQPAAGDPANGGDPMLPEDPAAVPSGGGAGSVQDTALNGAQVAAAVDIALKVATGELNPDAAVAMITNFFRIDETQARAIVEAQTKQASVVQAKEQADKEAERAAAAERFKNVKPNPAVAATSGMDAEAIADAIKLLNEGGGDDELGGGGPVAIVIAVAARVAAGVVTIAAGAKMISGVLGITEAKAKAMLKSAIKQPQKSAGMDQSMTDVITELYRNANATLS